jgi:peptidyl-dipeptidase A
MKFRVLLFVLSFLFVVQAQCASQATIAEAKQFMNQAQSRLNEIQVKAARASWVHENFITDDTQALSADVQDQLTAATTELKIPHCEKK